MSNENQADDASLLAIPLEFEFKGKTYKITNPINFGQELDFSRWVYLTAVDEIEKLRMLHQATNGRQGLSPEQYDHAFDRLTDRLAMGEFSWGSTIVNAKLNRSWPGIKHMIYLRMKPFDASVTPKLIERIFKEEEARARLMKVLNPSQEDEKKEEQEEESQQEKE